MTARRGAAHPASRTPLGDKRVRPAPRDMPSRGRSTALRVVGVVAVAAVLRPPIAGVGPVLSEVQLDLRLSAATVSALTALPVLCFGAGAFAGPALARRLGVDGALAAVLAALAAGLLIRVADGATVLVLGTALAGAAIAVANVLLPAVVKQDFPRRVGLMTGLYTATLSGFAALAALTAVPLGEWTASRWRAPLLAWGVVAVLALLLWLPQLRGQATRPPALAAPHPARRLLLNPQALALSAFMGLQSLTFYSVLTWLPSLLSDAGWSPAQSGALLSLATLIGVPAGLLLPPLAARSTDQRWLCLAVSAVTAAGLGGLLLAPAQATLLWVVLLGSGLGASFPLALLLIVLRSSAPAVTSQLSAMVQGLGYLLAASGPLLVGIVHEAAGSWTTALLLLLGCVLMQAAAGWVAGRAGHAA